MNTTISRVEKLRELMRSNEVDGLLLFNAEEASGVNIRYLSGFTGSTSICLVTPEAKILMTDDRYELQVKQESPGWNVRLDNLYRITDLLKEANLKRLGLISGETSWKRVNELRKDLPEIELVALPNVVKELRAVKDIGEVGKIKEAVRLMEKVLSEIYGLIRPGVTTDYELAAALRIKLIQRGSDVSFDPIILSGSDSAFIHGRPFKLRDERLRQGIVYPEKIIHPGDIIQFDVGCIVGGYHSDISRVAVVGKATDEQKMIHAVLCETIEAALPHYRDGARGQDGFDEAVRVLKAHGFEKGMVHGLGHGIGLEGHESPKVTVEAKNILRVGNVISLEPGIYREGYGGMRIERDIHITKDGHEILDELTTDLIEL